MNGDTPRPNQEPGENPSWGTPEPPAPDTPAASSAPPGEMHLNDQRTWSLFAHLGGLLGVYWLGWLPALVIYIVRGRRGAFLAHHAREALNFQITMVLAYLVVGIVDYRLDLPLSWATVLWVGNVVMIILASRAASRGLLYRYPVAVRAIR